MHTPAEIAKNYIAIGTGKANQKADRMFLLAVLAGMFIALAGAAATLGNCYINRAAGAAIFPAGLAMVLLAGSELFTGNCLLVIPLLERKVRVCRVLRNWGIVYLGNLVGALLVVCGTVYAGTFDGVWETVVATAEVKVSLSFGVALVRGIFCNVLVCLGVWMAFAAKSVGGKIAGLFFPIFVFVICGFEHSIANMFYIPAGLLSAIRFDADTTVTLLGFVWSNLVPVTLGNILGGAGLGVFYWAIYLRGAEQ
ncbi:MAG: formate/nitrite transporter family protein [Ruminococcaceae bacterium]|nr:formate/nitrite transporter family protein [Oscillospiraceae bacterium]